MKLSEIEGAHISTASNQRHFPDGGGTAIPFQILAVNLDKKTKKALKLLAKQRGGYPSVSNPRGDIPGKFDPETMPTYYLIDQNGVVRYVHKGFRDSDLDVLRKDVARIIK